MADNVPIFRLLAESFPDEHTTNCVDARVVSQDHSCREDPEDPGKTLHTLVWVLECPHERFELSLLMTTQKRHRGSG